MYVLTITLILEMTSLIDSILLQCKEGKEELVGANYSLIWLNDGVIFTDSNNATFHKATLNFPRDNGGNDMPSAPPYDFPDDTTDKNEHDEISPQVSDDSRCILVCRSAWLHHEPRQLSFNIS